MKHRALGELRRATGHRYPRLEQAVEKMTEFEAEDLIRLIRNLKSETQSEKNKRRRGQFWG